MPKRTLLLIVVLILVTVGLVWLSVYTVPQQKPATVTKQPEIVPFAKTTITLSSSPSATTVPNQYLLDAQIATADNKITAVQLELSYDPKALTKVDILPGDFIENPVVLLKDVDQKNGRISYTLGVKMGQPAVIGTGSIAKIQFSPLAGSNLTTTSINFLPKSKVSAESQSKSVLKSALGTIINLVSLNNPLLTPQATSGE